MDISIFLAIMAAGSAFGLLLALLYVNFNGTAREARAVRKYEGWDK